MIITDNAAYRLDNILKNVRKSNDKDKLFDIWARVLNVKNSDRSVVYKRLGYVATLPEEISKQISQFENINVELYLSWKTHISKLLNFNNLDTTWGGIKNWIPNESMTALSFCSEKISEIITNEEIEDEEIQDLAKEAEELIDEVESSDLTIEIKSFILERLKGVISALTGCNVYGPNNFKTEFESAIGSIALQTDMVGKVADTPFKDKFWNVMGKFATVISITTFCCITAPQELNKYLDAPLAKTEIVIEKSVTENGEDENKTSETEEKNDVIEAEFTET